LVFILDGGGQESVKIDPAVAVYFLGCGDPLVAFFCLLSHIFKTWLTKSTVKESVYLWNKVNYPNMSYAFGNIN
jgi:hypothetical protein